MVIDHKRLDRVINPNSVAVVGDSQKNNFRWLNNMKTFKGKVYSVHINPEAAKSIEQEFNIPNFKSLKDIPDEIDYVILNVPRKAAPAVLQDAVDKKVGGVAMFTSGFSETDTEEGLSLENTIIDIALTNDLIVIGPNCMGVYNSERGLRFSDHPVGNSKDITLISQSGSIASSFITAAEAREIPLGKAVSFGNGAVLENPDYLEYFAQDKETKFIVMYIEGVQDGKRFLEILKRTTPIKPVLIWKSGLTDAGQRATASHTNSLAGSKNIWEALCKQSGAIQVNSIEESMDILATLSMMKNFTGNRVGLAGGAGGQSVVMADDFTNAGFQVPALTKSSNQKLASFFSLIGAAYPNPIDMGSNRKEIETVIETLMEDDNIDFVTMQFSSSKNKEDQERAEFSMQLLTKHRERLGKPIASIVFSPDPKASEQSILTDMLQKYQIPSYSTYQRASLALKKVSNYNKFHTK
jgi:acyl-CoA synthetase (NDP forming)